MKILAYDTSGEVLTAALAVDEKIVWEAESNTGARHSDALVPMLEKILRQARWKPQDIDVLAVGVGPGSFTGIRVGVAAAKALGFIWKKKIVAVSSLEAAARALDGTGKAAVSLDARRGRVYAALYERQAKKMRTIIQPHLTTPEEFAKKIPASAAVWSGGPVRAAAFAHVAYERSLEKRFVNAESLSPLYLQPKDCNVTKK